VLGGTSLITSGSGSHGLHGIWRIITGGAAGASIFCAWLMIIGPGAGATPGSKYLTETSRWHSTLLGFFW
jgi:hypothetical protein